MATIRIFRLAERDFERAMRWYFKRSPATAYRFKDTFDAALKTIEANPLHFALIDRRHRSLLMKPFPYLVIFRLESQTINIVAVVHTKRRSGFWNRRKP